MKRVMLFLTLCSVAVAQQSTQPSLYVLQIQASTVSLLHQIYPQGGEGEQSFMVVALNLPVTADGVLLTITYNDVNSNPVTEFRWADRMQDGRAIYVQTFPGSGGSPVDQFKNLKATAKIETPTVSITSQQ